MLPPILSGQFTIVDAEIKGQMAPVAVAFWVHVSPEIDQRLTATPPNKAVPLLPNEWRSGEIPWESLVAPGCCSSKPSCRDIRDSVIKTPRQSKH